MAQAGRRSLGVPFPFASVYHPLMRTHESHFAEIGKICDTDLSALEFLLFLKMNNIAYTIEADVERQTFWLKAKIPDRALKNEDWVAVMGKVHEVI